TPIGLIIWQCCIKLLQCWVNTIHSASLMIAEEPILFTIHAQRFDIMVCTNVKLIVQLASKHVFVTRPEIIIYSGINRDKLCSAIKSCLEIKRSSRRGSIGIELAVNT